MAGIDPLGISALYSPAAKKQEEKNKTKKSTKKVSFSTILNKEQQVIETDNLLPPEIEGKSFEDALQYLVDSVYTNGDELKKKSTPENFKLYHDALSGFMRFVVKNSYEIETVVLGYDSRK